LKIAAALSDIAAALSDAGALQGGVEGLPAQGVRRGQGDLTYNARTGRACRSARRGQLPK